MIDTRNLKHTQVISATFAYMIGIPKEKFVLYEDTSSDILNKLKSDKNATIIRSLCILRNCLMKNFSKTDTKLYGTLENINKQPWFNQEAISFLIKNNINPILTNARASKYAVYFNELIDRYIDKCKSFYPEWVNWKYIRNLFYKSSNPKILRNEFDKFHQNYEAYPFQCYFNWQTPSVQGYLLTTDKKFLDIVYEDNHDTFDNDLYVQDVPQNSKNEIYDFVQQSTSTIVAVDCENTDCIALCGVLGSLNSDELNKITKIILFDDPNTTSAWGLLHKFTSIPVEHIDIQRVTQRKSLVDIRMTAGVCAEYYKGNADSFILFSSDSDFWGLISSLPEAKFIVLYQAESVGEAIKEVWKTHNIKHYDIDDFCQENSRQFKKAVLGDLLASKLSKIQIGNAKDMTQEIFRTSKIPLNEKEKKEFYEKFIRKITVDIREDGDFYLKIAE